MKSVKNDFTLIVLRIDFKLQNYLTYIRTYTLQCIIVVKLRHSTCTPATPTNRGQQITFSSHDDKKGVWHTKILGTVFNRNFDYLFMIKVNFDLRIIYCAADELDITDQVNFIWLGCISLSSASKSYQNKHGSYSTSVPLLYRGSIIFTASPCSLCNQCWR